LSRTMFRRISFYAMLIISVCAAGVWVDGAAADTWTPQAGDVNLEETPRNTPQARFKHACGLVTAGQAGSALEILEELIEKHPDADFTGRARYVRGLAAYRYGEPWDAFEYLEDFLQQHPDSSWAQEARNLQLQAARTVGEDDMDDGVTLLDRLVKQGGPDVFIARCRKEKAELLYRNKRYLRAKDAYLAVVDYHPQSRWVPDSYLRVGQCELQLGLWLRLGLQHIERGRKTLAHLVELYGEEEATQEAKEALERARRAEAREIERIARFYIEDKHRPEAALPYLRYLMDEFPETKPAGWAAKQVKDIRNTLSSPPRDSFHKVSLSKSSKKSQAPSK